MNRRLLAGCLAGCLAVALAALLGVGALAVWGAAAFSDGLFPSDDFADATEAQVEARGYRLPDGAAHVYIKDRGAMDVRVTWLAYELPESAFDALRAEVAAAAGATRVDDPTPPHDWPDFTIFDDMDPPPWWAPSGGEVYRFEHPFDAEPGQAGGTSYTRGRLWVFDADTRRVWHTMWSWQWWTFEPTG